MEDRMPESARQRTVKRWIQLVVTTGLFLGALFGGAGRLDWLRGWIFAGLYMAGMAGTGVVMHRLNPELIEARSKWRRKDTKPFDKVFLSLFLPLTLIQPAIGGLDAVRFQWTSLPFRLVWPGAAILGSGMALIAWTLAVNRHAETTVRIQTDRGHAVVSAGPYRFVRHPMYVGLILTYLAAPLILGSLWSLAVGCVIVGLVVWRTAMEDRTLRRELAGYEEFASRTQYRLAPGVW
jgi:protein-S-isoprenylcysteine O-methyltransferase Ste14